MEFPVKQLQLNRPEMEFCTTNSSSTPLRWSYAQLTPAQPTRDGVPGQTTPTQPSSDGVLHPTTPTQQPSDGVLHPTTPTQQPSDGVLHN